MQFTKVANELITDKNISANEFRIYVYLLSLYNEKKKMAFPSYETISNRTGISISTIRRSIKHLVFLGYMAIEKVKGVSGNHNTYKRFKYLVKKAIKEVKTSYNDLFNKIRNDSKSVDNISSLNDYCNEDVETKPYKKDHENKISLCLKYGIKLTYKQEKLLGCFNLDLLRNALKVFKKKNGRNFSFLIDLYYDVCARYEVVPNESIQRYCGNKYIKFNT
jgi:predicted transcriptional regulator